MMINNKIFLNLVNKPNFKISDITRKVPDTKVSKDLTYLDIIAFRQYVQARKSNFNISSEEIEKLAKEKGERFLNSALKFLLKKLNISEEIAPEIRYVRLKNSDGVAGNCDIHKRIININEKNKKSDVRTQLMVIRHELEHWKQMVDALRCDATSEFMMQKNAFSLTLREKNIQYVDENNYAFVKKLLDNRDKDSVFQKHYKQQKQYRNKVIKYLGKIDTDSPEAKKCLKYVDEINNFNRVTENRINYMCSDMEASAYLQEVTIGEQLFQPKACKFADFKRINKRILDDLVRREAENKENSTQNFKDLLNSQPDSTISFLG